MPDLMREAKAFSGFATGDVAAARAFYGINRRGGRYFAWFDHPGANVLSVLQERA